MPTEGLTVETTETADRIDYLRSDGQSFYLTRVEGIEGTTLYHGRPTDPRPMFGLVNFQDGTHGRREHAEAYVLAWPDKPEL